MSDHLQPSTQRGLRLEPLEDRLLLAVRQIVENHKSHEDCTSGCTYEVETLDSVSVSDFAVVPGPHLRGQDANELGIGQGQFTLSGAKWPASLFPIRYYVNTSGLAPGLSESAYVAAIDSCFQTIEDISTTAISFEKIGHGTQFGTGASDGTTTVGFGTAVPGSLAHSTWYTNGAGIYEFDVVLGTDRASWSTSPGGGQVDVWSTAAHEIGHGIGLGHSEDTQATMYYAIFVGSTHQRDFNGDDISGLEQLYPLPATPPPIAKDDVYTVDEDVVLVVNAENGVMNNDFIPAGESLTTRVVKSPSHGTVVLNADGSFQYTPQANYFGSDSFSYQLLGGAGGESEGTVTIDVMPRPSEPTNVAAKSITNEAAVVHWTPSSDPSGDPITYEVGFRKDNLTDSWSTTQTTSVPQIQLIGLEPGTSYRVRVRASDSELFSEWVEAVNLFSTTAAPSAPGSLSVMSITHTSALVLWQPSPDVNFSTVAYEVQHRKSDLSDDWHPTSPTTALGQMLEGLQMGTSYRVRVRAFSGQLYSDWRDVNHLFTTTMDEMAPSSPGELTVFSATETTALVTWAAAIDPNGDPVVYQVQYRKSDLSDDWTPTAATTALGQQLSGLQPGTSYRVRVRGFDGKLYGPWTDVSNLFITILNTPTAPTMPGPLSTEWVTDRLAMLRWGESLDPNGDEVTYYVEFRKADLSTDWVLAFSTKATEHALIGLEPGASYHVRVLAYDGGLASQWQQADNLFTTDLPEGVPTTPGSLSIISILETMALVSWDASLDSNNDDLVYEVQFRESNSGDSWTVTTPIQSLGKFLEGLSPGTSYDVRVRALDGQFYSLWREADHLFTTLGSAAIAGDINQDGLVDALDIDSLFAAISSSATDERMDLNEDSVLDKRDVDYLVRSILGTNYGDTNLNGRVDTADLTRAIIHFTSAGGVGMRWNHGDTDGDGDVDSSDLTTAIINFTGASHSPFLSFSRLHSTVVSPA